MKTYEAIDCQHKALLFMASAVVKTFLMAIVSSYAFCGSTDPNVLFSAKCYGNIPFVAGSTGAVATMSTLFGYYIVRLKAFDSIFARVMKTDFIITSMYFAVAFSAPSIVAAKVMVWLFGMWVLGMLLAPLNKQMTTLKRITEYGSLVALGALLTAHFIPPLQSLQQSYTLGMSVSSILGLFGAGRSAK